MAKLLAACANAPCKDTTNAAPIGFVLLAVIVVGIAVAGLLWYTARRR